MIRLYLNPGVLSLLSFFSPFYLVGSEKASSCVYHRCPPGLTHTTGFCQEMQQLISGTKMDFVNFHCWLACHSEQLGRQLNCTGAASDTILWTMEHSRHCGGGSVLLIGAEW